MKPSEYLKNLPAPARMLYRPMLIISLVLHGVVLILPIPSEQEKPKQKLVKITQLPPTQASPNSSPQSSPKPSPQPSSQLSQSTSLNLPTSPELPSSSNSQLSSDSIEPTRSNSETLPESPTKENPQSNAQLNQSDSSKSKKQSDNSSTSESKPKSNSDSQRENSQPAKQESNSSQSQSSKSQTSAPAANTNTTTSNASDTNADATNVKDPLEDFLKNFPFPENAIAGSLGVLPTDSDGSARHVRLPLDGVLKFYGKELPERKYSPLGSPKPDDQDLKIYQVSKGKASQYLHLISKGEDTVIFLSATPVPREKLANLEVETAQQREFKEILKKTIPTDSTQKLTSDIESKLVGGKYITLGIFPGKTPKQLGDDFTNALNKNKFMVAQSPINLGPNGLIYAAKKNDFTGYIQLIPTSDGTGTAIIVLDKLSNS